MLTQDNSFVKRASLIAQAEADSPLSDVPASVSLSDSTRVGPYSVLLKDAFEASQSEQILQLNEGISDPDLVAIARSLTPEERAQGLRQQLVTREKIALVIDVNNPFQGTLTLEQVSGIFRGEITNWSQVGGGDRPLNLIHRSVQNATRQALEGYGVLDNSQFASSALETDLDSTTEVLEALGANEISYAPASETIEQFGTRVVTIDNVGVDDGRYPFSLPLNYVYRSQPKPDVQAFLDFLQSPDAQSAIEFAQSQPADPTRVMSQPDLSALSTQSSTSSADQQTDTSPTETEESVISVSPLESPLQGTAVEQSPVGVESPENVGGFWSWIPLLLIFLAMGVLSWLTYMRVSLEKKRKSTPRPAPNYAARLNAQGSNRNMAELRAIAEGAAKAKSANQGTKLSQPDLSLGDDQLESTDIHHDEVADVRERDDAVLWEEDITELQGPGFDVSVPPSEIELESDMTTLQPAESESESILPDSGQPTLEPEDDLNRLVVPHVVDPEAEQSTAEHSVVEASDSERPNVTIMQDDNHLEDPQRDPLTGQLTEELETLSELEEKAKKIKKKLAEKQASQPAESIQIDSDQNADASLTQWDEISDPWD